MARRGRRGRTHTRAHECCGWGVEVPRGQRRPGTAMGEQFFGVDVPQQPALVA
jgi:hypothetical protein